ncbi:hypothetical protein [Enterococcus sp. DIV0756]|uniref:hypothetical protein n=1 Tax=Enterococcus sp. DIV0756 TaxID=2774636 RepID=UPI003F6888F7
MKTSLKELAQAILLCLIVPSTLLLQKNNPFIDYDLSYREIFLLFLIVMMPVLFIWLLKELWKIYRRKW